MPKTFIYKIAEKAYEIFDQEKVEDDSDLIDAVECGHNYIDVETIRMGIHLKQTVTIHLQYISKVKQSLNEDHGIDLVDYGAITAKLQGVKT